MRKTLVLFVALALTGMSSAYGQKSAQNEIKITKLSNGEIWARIQIRPLIAVQLLSGMPATGQFQTHIVMNLPESDIVNAPQSEDIAIWGNCQSKTYTVIGVMPYSGKMRSGIPAYPELERGPEGVTRRIQPNSPMEQVFKVVCKP
jgi:hypothetical protein